MAHTRPIYATHRTAYSGFCKDALKIVIGYERVCDCGEVIDGHGEECDRCSMMRRHAEGAWVPPVYGAFHFGVGTVSIAPKESLEKPKPGERCSYCGVRSRETEKHCTSCGAAL